MILATPANKQVRSLLLCAGMQCSGSTMISWCFLQRPDLDGILDGRYDLLPDLPLVSTTHTWCKLTIACFRLTEAVSHYRDDGWDVKPLLVVRDVRAIFNSLLVKEYGRNGTTADDPPIRLRMRRFLLDWQYAVDQGWPILRYEDVCRNPEESLRLTCQRIGLPWDTAMLSWPKSITAIADARHGNHSFLESRSTSLQTSVHTAHPVAIDDIPTEDLDWLESEFADFNRACQYPAAIARPDHALPGRARPSFEASRQHWRKIRSSPLAKLRRWISAKQ